MANIFCTRKLEKLVGKKLMSSAMGDEHPLGNWNANLFPLKGRKCLIVMNDVSYYTLIFLDVLKKDLNNFHELFYMRLIEQLDYDGISFPLSGASKLMDYCDPIFLSTNNNRKVLGTINDYLFQVPYHFYEDYFGSFEHTQICEINHRLNNNLVGALKPRKFDYGRPIEEMKKCIAMGYPESL